MNALSTPSHLPSRQNSSRVPSGAEMTAEEEPRSARQEMFSQQVGPLCHRGLSDNMPCLFRWLAQSYCLRRNIRLALFENRDILFSLRLTPAIRCTDVHEPAQLLSPVGQL